MRTDKNLASEKLEEVLENRKRILIAYLNEKLREEDWHGVMDASADIREIEAKLSVLK